VQGSMLASVFARHTIGSRLHAMSYKRQTLHDWLLPSKKQKLTREIVVESEWEPLHPSTPGLSASPSGSNSNFDKCASGTLGHAATFCPNTVMRQDLLPFYC
jgi:hypothetical protein